MKPSKKTLLALALCAPAAHAAERAPAPEACTRPISSATLLRGRKVLCIEHHGAIYCLRVTRQDKLILTN